MKNAIGNCITTDKWQNGSDFENSMNEKDIHFIKQVLDLRRATYYGKAVRSPKTPTRPELVRLACVLAVARKLTTSGEMLLWMIPSEAPKALRFRQCKMTLQHHQSKLQVVRGFISAFRSIGSGLGIGDRRM